MAFYPSLAFEEALAMLIPAIQRVIDHILDSNDGTVFATMTHDNEQHIITNAQIDCCAK